MTNHQKSAFIKSLAMELGFLTVGIAKAEYMEEEARRVEKWLGSDYHGEMSYMANHFDKRVDPTKLVPGSKSVISLSYNYNTELKQEDSSAPKISQYAYGRDYHKVIKKKMKEFVYRLQSEFGEFDGRCFVDSAPILERDWARRAGLGWIGKHSLLLTKKQGSYFFLTELICDLELAYDHPVSDHCGSCTACIDACPTDAIAPSGYVLDANKCISYLTIELKNEIPSEFKDKMENWMFGCDICQDVCPWNRFAHQHNEADFQPPEQLLKMTKDEWEEITPDIFDTLFQGSAVKRTKYEGLKRNIKYLNE